MSLKEWLRGIRKKDARQELILTGEDHDTILKEISWSMLRRVRIFTAIVFLIHLAIVVLIVPGNMKIYQGQTLQAYIQLLYCDICIIAVSFLYFILTSASYPPTPSGITRASRFLVVSYCFLLLLWAAVKTAFQQVFVGQISIYLVVLLAMGAGGLLTFRASLIVYLIPCAAFVTGTLYFKKSIPLLQDNLINGCALTFVSWFLSRIIYNNTHGNLVKQRIIEIQKNDLQKERNELEKNYNLLEEELSLARKIQDLMIPRNSPMPGVASLYKPMSQVGGDFFDYVHFRETGELGIFLSDVSGHGVPAAFITSMIKSFILQSRNELRDPAEFFRLLNDHLFQRTNDNFITAFYGILNFGTRTLRYTNAGHCRPIVIDSSGSHFINFPDNGFPLAVLSRVQMQKIGKDFRNHEVSLDGASKIMLYTDGLTESEGHALPDQEFGPRLIGPGMSDHCKTPPADFIHLMYQQLVDFHGSELFEDDICMICVDL